VSEEKDVGLEKPNGNTSDFLDVYLSKGNPRIPIVTVQGGKTYVLGFLRFVRARGKITIGRDNTFDGSVCGIELVIRKDMWNDYKKSKVQVGENYVHFRIQMLTPERVLLLARRLEQMAYMLLIENVLNSASMTTEKKTEKSTEKEEVDLDIERL